MRGRDSFMKAGILYAAFAAVGMLGAREWRLQARMYVK